MPKLGFQEQSWEQRGARALWGRQTSRAAGGLCICCSFPGKRAKPPPSPRDCGHGTPPDVEFAALQVSKQGDRLKSSGLACVCTASRYLTVFKFPDEE